MNAVKLHTLRVSDMCKDVDVRGASTPPERCAGPSTHLNQVIELKHHSSDLLRHIYKQNDGDDAYLFVPKLTENLLHYRVKMLAEVEKDVTSIKGCLWGLDKRYHVSMLGGASSAAVHYPASCVTIKCTPGDVQY
jgi:hypothetical protein